MFMKYYNSVDLKVEKLENTDNEFAVLADKYTQTYEGADGKKHKFTDYKFNQRVYGQDAANDKVMLTMKYIEKVVFDYVDTGTSNIVGVASVIMESPEFSSKLRKLGYDGVIQSKDGDEAVVFDSEQIKAADPITYDDNGNIIPLSKRFDSENEDIRYSLEPVKPIQPKNGEWERGRTTDEVRAKHPDLWAVDAESSESRNPTQISGTVKSYRKIYDALKAEGFDGTVLDASSGLGYGTRAGIEEYGFNVEDIEPFPDSSYKPKYTDYSKLHKKYDVIISNAVLNVLPQDQRDALVVKMGQMLNDGGRMFINVRGTDVRNASSKVPIDEANMEYYISNTGSYQKGFTKKELVAYLSDALGKDYTVVGTNKFGAVSAVVTKQAEVSKKFSREPERLNELRRQNERKLAQATAEDAANENERGLIKDYNRQYDKVSGIAEKLNTARQEVLTAERSGGGNTTAKKKIKKHRTHCPVFGRGRRLRTLGLRFWRPPLYQLSYSPIKLVGLQGLEPQTDRL